MKDQSLKQEIKNSKAFTFVDVLISISKNKITATSIANQRR